MSEFNDSFSSENTNTETKNSLNYQNQLFQFFENNNSKLQAINYSSDKQKKLRNYDDSNNKKNSNLLGPLKGENDPEKQLLYYFKDKKIYIEIFNGNSNSSSIFYDMLVNYKIIQCKKLSKKIDYIVFKDGHLKTQKYASLNNIKLVNPLWIDDKVNHHIFKDDKEYEIKTNFGDIMLIEKYEKNKNKEKNEKNDEDISDKNYEHELEPEYDTPYANYIDKLREKNSEKNNDNEISTIEKTFNNDKNNKFNELKDITNINNNNDIKREKRKISIINDLENRQTIINNEENIKIFKETKNTKKNKNNSKDDKNNQNKSTKNHKNTQKNKEKRKNSKSVNKNTQSTKNSQKNTNKKKFMNDNENKNNYILKINQNNSNILSFSQKTETQPTSDKINIMSYMLKQNEIQSLKTLNYFEYKGNLNNKDKDKKLYNNTNIIILEKDKVIYDWKMYEFLLDKKIIIDFASFLFEFINDDNSNNNFNLNILKEEINKISINNEIYFFNKKKRMQKRSMMQCIKIVDNIISKEKNEQNKQSQNDHPENMFFFMINNDINENEKKIIQKLLKNYLKGEIINNNMSNKRAKSVASKINLNFEKLTKKNNLEIIKENHNTENKNKKESNEIGKSNDLDINLIDNNIPTNKNKNDDTNISNEKVKEKQNIEGIYLISKKKSNNIKYFKNIKYYKGVISYKYIYDSFLNGLLLNLSDKDIFDKYKLQ